MNIQPIELRIDRSGKCFNITAVYEGVGNTRIISQLHMTYSDAVNWCKQEYPTVPRIKGW